MEFHLLHSTRYRYSQASQLGPQQIRLRPSGPRAGQLSHYRLQLFPAPQVGYWRTDPWNNWVYQAWYSQPVPCLTVINRLRYRPMPHNPFDFVVDQGGEIGAIPPAYLEDCPTARDWAHSQLPSPELSPLEQILQLNQAVHSQVGYRIRPEAGVQTPQETLDSGQGSCRDSAWLLVLALRGLGIPARLVSGYWLQPTAKQAVLELHAWSEAYLPGAGWLGIDPSAGLVVSQQHLALARGPSAEWVAPLQGSHSGSLEDWSFRLKLRQQR